MNAHALLGISLLVAGCAAKPAPLIETVYVPVETREVLVDRPRREAPLPSGTLAIVRHKDALVAAASHYVASPHSKPHTIRSLTELTSAATQAVTTLTGDRNPKAYAADRATALAKVEALAAGLRNANNSALSGQ